MDAQKLDQLERLTVLHEKGALSESEFRREKSILLNRPRKGVAAAPGEPAHRDGSARELRVVSGAAGPPADRARRAAPPRRRRRRPPPSRVGMLFAWLLWILFSIGGLAAMQDGQSLVALLLLLCGLLFAPPFQRLLSAYFAPVLRMAFTAVAAFAVLGIGLEGPGAAKAVPTGDTPAEMAEALRAYLEHGFAVRGERVREGIARPWRTAWEDLVWSRGAATALLDDWHRNREP
jgi:hypothetical protein